MTLFPTFHFKPESAVNRTFLLLSLVALGACGKTETKVATIPTATIQRRDIVVNAEATGIIEPINVIEVKSKTASGQVTKMSIEIGTFVKPGDLIVQIDTTDLHTQFEQSKADLAAATSNFERSASMCRRRSSTVLMPWEIEVNSFLSPSVFSASDGAPRMSGFSAISF